MSNTPAVPDRPRLPWDPPDHFEKRVPDGDNRERLVCARCEFIHYQNPKIVAGAVCTWDDRILLAKRAIEPRKGFWTLPAGYMELGETTEQAAEREAREEACANIEIERLLAMYSVARIGQVQIMYRARLVSADVAPGVESEEVALVEWADIPWEQDRLSDLLQSNGRSRPHVAAAQAGGSLSVPDASGVQDLRFQENWCARICLCCRFYGLLLSSYERSVSGRIWRKPC
jgi:ADP-ribose pyrophosphatase YjhB (NUDIX family)